MKHLILIFAFIVPLTASAIGEQAAPMVVEDTLILVPIHQGREVRILEGERISLRLSDGSKLEGELQDVSKHYLVVGHEKVYFNEIAKVGISSNSASVEGRKGTRKGRGLLSLLIGGGLVLLGIGAISGLDLGSLIDFDSPQGSDPISELVRFFLWILGIVVLAVVVIVAAVFLLPVILGGVVAFFAGLFGLSQGGSKRNKRSRSKRGMYNTVKDYSIKAGMAK